MHVLIYSTLSKLRSLHAGERLKGKQTKQTEPWHCLLNPGLSTIYYILLLVCTHTHTHTQTHMHIVESKIA